MLITIQELAAAGKFGPAPAFGKDDNNVDYAGEAICEAQITEDMSRFYRFASSEVQSGQFESVICHQIGHDPLVDHQRVADNGTCRSRANETIPA